MVNTKQQRQIATAVVTGDALGLTVMPAIFTYDIFGALTLGLILGLGSAWVAYGLWKNKF